MKMNNKILLPVLVITLTGLTIFGTSYIFAETDGDHPFVTKLAAKLGIEESKVLSAFTEIRAEHRIEMQNQITEKLTQAVKDGKITETQKQAILAKHKELQAERETNREQFKNMTPEERKASMEKKREELKTWADANGIDLQYFFGGIGQHHGFGKRMMTW